MHRAFRVIWIFLAILFIHLPASAEEGLTGTDLMNLCHNTDAQYERACNSYISGYTAGYFAAQQAYSYGLFVCLPEGVSNDQIKLLVEKAARDRPAILNEGANSLITVALVEAFRCKSGERPRGAKPN